MPNVKPIPDGFSSVTPHLVVKDAAKALDLWKTALGAEERFRMPSPDGRIMHAEISIGNAIVMIADDYPEMCGGHSRSPTALGGTPVSLHLYVADCDASYNRAIKAGFTPTMPPADMFWGDRYALATDPFGHMWSFATHQRDLTPEQMAEGMKQAFSQGG